MDKGTVFKRVEMLQASISSKILMIHKMSIALNLFDTGLNKSLRIKSKRYLKEYLSKKDLMDDFNDYKHDIVILIRKLQIARRQLAAIKMKEDIKAGPKKV